MDDAMKTLASKVTVLENGKGGGVLAGHPAVLSALCGLLGFKNSCSDGRIYLTAPKMARIGLADARGMVPDWRNLHSDTLWAISMDTVVA